MLNGKPDYLRSKYLERSGGVLITGVQALVRLTLVQADRDRAAGINTGGFVSGYRGSPLGTLDSAFATVPDLLEARRIVVRPAVNEEMAATAIGGTQHIAMTDGAEVQGIFSLWYGKGPGVDRASDALRHANYAGTSRFGGVVMAVGDDHQGKSSSLVVNSNGICAALNIPLLFPSDPGEVVRFGLHGFAASRLTGSWLALKIVPDVADSTQTIDLDAEAAATPIEPEIEQPADGLNIRWPDTLAEMEFRQHRYRLAAVQRYVRANRLDRIEFKQPGARIGVMAAGKAWSDVGEALTLLGLDEDRMQDLGVALYKPALIWPVEPEGLTDFARDLDLIVVVEEKGPFIETQARSILFGSPGAPRVERVSVNGQAFLPDDGVLSPDLVAARLAAIIARETGDARLAARSVELDVQFQSRNALASPVARRPHFCSGCPHNRSTALPEGSRASAGIGCHSMAVWIADDTAVWAQMGGEGIQWTGLSPFTREKHVFANIGDGTYFHSGSLAIRQAVAAGANMTYKILYNDAVAMTGGQRVDGVLTVPLLVDQLRSEGVRTIRIVTDDVAKYSTDSYRVTIPVDPREDLDQVQRELREVPGVSVLIYDQMCATELRRQRKRGTMVDPDRRVIINELVCEGCGDCSIKSNCLSVEPVDTPFGSKRRINQSTCNKDLSCRDGFCPSFVTVQGGTPKKAAAITGSDLFDEELPDPALPAVDEHHRIVVAGIGGTGVVTIGALLTTAAHLSGRAAAVLDEVGMAQKGGAVQSSIHIANDVNRIKALKITQNGADLVLACDQVVANAPDLLASVRRGHTHVIANGDVAITGEFIRSGAPVNRAVLKRRLRDRAGEGRVDEYPFGEIASRILGDAIGSNLMMVGYAYQRGLIPASAEAIGAAIEINGAAVAMNRRAFHLGRLLAVDPDRVLRAGTAPGPKPDDLASLVEKRAAFLTNYQNKAYAQRYRDAVDKVRHAEGAVGDKDALTTAAAKSMFRLMAYKDEYEVARLYTDGSFERQLRETFDGDLRLTFHLAPPVLPRRDPASGHPRKRAFGPWMLPAFRVLARLRGLRGTWADPFGRTAERRMERALIVEFEAALDQLTAGLSDANHAAAVTVAELPLTVKGYGHIKDRSVAIYRPLIARMLADYAEATPGRSEVRQSVLLTA